MDVQMRKCHGVPPEFLCTMFMVEFSTPFIELLIHNVVNLMQLISCDFSCDLYNLFHVVYFMWFISCSYSLPFMGRWCKQGIFDLSLFFRNIWVLYAIYGLYTLSFPCDWVWQDFFTLYTLPSPGHWVWQDFFTLYTLPSLGHWVLF